MPMTINQGERRSVPFPVRGVDLTTGNTVNPSASALSVGFALQSAPIVVPGTFYPASWLTNVLTQSIFGSVLVGPGGGVLVLAPGAWRLWVSFLFGPELVQHPIPDVLNVV